MASSSSSKGKEIMDVEEQIGILEVRFKKIEEDHIELKELVKHNADTNKIDAQNLVAAFNETVDSKISMNNEMLMRVLNQVSRVPESSDSVHPETAMRLIELPYSLVIFSWENLKRFSNDFRVSIGEGNNGRVYKGEWAEAQLEVVLKVFDLKRGNEVDSYESELKAIKTVTHKNFIGCLGIASRKVMNDDHFDKRAIVYRFAEKGALQDHLGELDWKQVVTILKGITLALQCLHSKGLVHRDIKPANILLTEDFTPKLADFGSTKDDNTPGYSMTAGYVDPDVLTQGTCRTHHDLFSLGTVLLQVLADWKRPFHQTEGGNNQHIYKWMKEQLERGNSIISMRLRETGCNRAMEDRIVDIVHLMMNLPSERRYEEIIPKIEAVQNLSEELKKEETDMKGKGKGKGILKMIKKLRPGSK